MKKLLIVEDDPLILRMYEEAFSFRKYEVAIADNGQDGLAKAGKEQPDMILLDIMMPKMNGLEVLKQLKQDPKLKMVPVVMLTNLSGDDDIETAMSLGAVKYITKVDHTPTEIVHEVEEVASSSK